MSAHPVPRRRGSEPPWPVSHVLAKAAAWLAVVAVAACDPDAPEPTTPSVGTNSNWLRACAPEDPCGDPPECRCGACTLPCESDADCGGLANARCADGDGLAVLAECGASTDVPGAGFCLPRCAPGSCDQGQACIDEACVLAPLPDVPFCDPVADPEPDARALEEELLARLQDLRAAGGNTCGTTAPAAPAAGLRFDARLVCAARVLAADLAVTRALSVTDSDGRDTRDRLTAAGHTPSLWADGFALDPADATQALELMRTDDGTCQRLTDGRYDAVGVGAADGVLVITIAADP